MDTARGSNVLCVAFGIFVVLEVIGLQMIGVDCYPLSLDVSGMRIHQKQPSYMPDYTGIFSLHALNFTPAAIDKTEKFLQVLNEDNALVANVSFGALLSTTTSEGGRQHEFTDQTIDRLVPETGFTDYYNEVDHSNVKLDLDVGTTKADKDYGNTNVDLDSGNSNVDKDSNNVDLPDSNDPNVNLVANLQDSSDFKLEDNPKEDLTTFPQIHVVTKVITTEVFQPSTTTELSTIGTTQTEDVKTTTEPTPTITEVIRFVESNSSDALLTDAAEDGKVEAGEKQPDIFDHLMKSIQSNWLDFVGKMKMSVLDVWKTISQHMMERMENFASAL